MSNIPAEFHFFRKTWFQNPVLRSKLNPTRPCEDRPQSAAEEYWVERRGRGIETAGGSHEKTIFQRAAKEDEGDGKSDSQNMYVMVLCRHRCRDNSFQLKISGHLATNMRFIFLILNQTGISVRILT